MFLIKAIKNYFYPPANVILVLGLDNSGKTTLLHMLDDNFRLELMHARFHPYKIFDEIRIDNMHLISFDLGYNTNQRIKAQIGELKIEGIVFMVDLTDKQRLEEAVGAFESITQYINNETGNQIPMVLVGSKSDLKDAMSLEELQHIFQDCHQFQNLKVLTCSAARRLGLKEPFDWLRSQFQQ